MQSLANALGIKVYSRSRILNDSPVSSYTVIAGGAHSITIIIEYFSKLG